MSVITPGTVCIVGAGGLAREAAWLAKSQGIRIAAHVVSAELIQQADTRCSPVAELERVDPSIAAALIAVGDPLGRRRLAGQVAALGFSFFPPLIASTSRVGERLRIGNGCIVFPGVVITVDVDIGDHVLINANATVPHDVVIEDFVTVSPGANISGRVHIEQGAFIGAGATIIEGSPHAPLVIGREAVVAAGAVVTKNVPANAMVAGVPAVRKR